MPYLRAETITSANARLVDFQATLPLAQIWGELYVLDLCLCL
ncbi:hypothetical protein DPF84_27175 (plasmid) [Enterobacter hormaechei]|nr:hypothetical protein DPF84_27175 [Enterobacter hormaechei]RAM39746.1 hypothetical protein DOZ52_27490 [Enterobacter hormaechei]